MMLGEDMTGKAGGQLKRKKEQLIEEKVILGEEM